MKGFRREKICALIFGFSLLLIPAIIQAGYQQTPQGAPPVAQPLIREGSLAVALSEALNLGTANSEAEAESWLGEKGIAPKNGWIADYPVTPDIIGELNAALGDAADARKIALNRGEAQQRLDAIVKELGVSITAAGNDGTPLIPPEDASIIPESDVYDYYSEEGPPVVTYYAPPPDYYYLYSWVPYPFWWSGFWFGGFFILNDFHRAVFFDHDRFHHGRGFVSNHFHAGGSNHFSRVDPVTRSGARSFTGTRAAWNGHAGAGVRANSGNMRSNWSAPRAQQSVVNRSRQSFANSGTNRNGTWGGRGYNSPTYRAPFAQSGRFATSRGYTHPVGSHAQYPGYASSAGSFSQRSSFSSPIRGGFSGASSFRGGGGFSGGHGGGGFSGGHGGGRR